MGLRRGALAGLSSSRPASILPIARSVLGREVVAFIRSSRASASTVLVLGGVHGDEPKGVYVCRKLIEHLDSNSAAGDDVSWAVLPTVNPDGLAARCRRNANRVDLNRNFPTKNWTLGRRRSRMYGGDSPASEPETRAVMEVVQILRPAWIITVHSIGRGRHCNNYDGPARRLAQAMRRFNHYPVRRTIGYPTPGSFGTWAGVELGIPTLTLELPSLHSPKRCWDDNRDALLIARP